MISNREKQQILILLKSECLAIVPEGIVLTFGELLGQKPQTFDIFRGDYVLKLFVGAVIIKVLRRLPSVPPVKHK